MAPTSRPYDVQKNMRTQTLVSKLKIGITVFKEGTELDIIVSDSTMKTPLPTMVPRRVAMRAWGFAEKVFFKSFLPFLRNKLYLSICRILNSWMTRPSLAPKEDRGVFITPNLNLGKVL